MKLCFIIVISILLSLDAHSQTEELHVFYVDLAQRPTARIKNGVDYLPMSMFSKMQQIGDSILNNNGQIIFYQVGGISIDTLPAKVKSRLKRLQEKDAKPYSADRDAYRIRELIGSYHKKWGRFISLNIHFFLPTDGSIKMFEEYNDFRCILLNELGFQNPYADVFSVNFHLFNQNPGLSRLDLKKYNSEFFKKRLFAFGNYDVRFQQTRDKFSFFFY